MRDPLSFALLLGILIFFGVRAALEDIRTGKIPNRILLQGMAASLFLWGFLFLSPGKEGVAAHALSGLLSASLFAVIAFGLWWFGLWAAGDGKLFILAGFLLHPALFPKRGLWQIAFLALLFTFSGAMIFLMIDLAARIWNRLQKEGFYSLIRKARFPQDSLSLFFGFASLFLFLRIFRLSAMHLVKAHLPISDSHLYLLLFLIFKPATRLFRPKMWPYLLVASTALLFLAKVAFQWDLLKEVPRISIFALFLLFAGKIYAGAASTLFVKETAISDLVPGMLVPEWAILQRFGKDRPSELRSFVPDGLTSEQVEVIKRLCPVSDRLPVARSIPLAPFILLGTMLALIL